MEGNDDKKDNLVTNNLLLDDVININEGNKDHNGSFDFSTDENHENENYITPDIHFVDRKEKDINTLKDMGFDENLINRIYTNVHPFDIQDALDYLSKDGNDKFTHSFIPNDNNTCLICGEKSYKHSISTSLTEEREREQERERERQRERERNFQQAREREREREREKNKYLYDYKSKSYLSKYYCGVCGDEIDYKDRTKVKLPCDHMFCKDCWFEYLKEKVNNANVYKITCMDHKCGYILQEKFVKDMLGNDEILQQKYDKFLNRKKLMDSNKKIKFCPVPDCDGYAEKKKSKYVTCNYGHEFCFECGNKPHGKTKCSVIIDEDFEKWKKQKLIKRCPYCKYWTEKNEGCNHMTCIQCKFQWCWVCEKECVAGHYSFGACKGLHFENIVSQEQSKKLMHDNVSVCCVLGFIGIKLGFLLMYLLLMPCFTLAVLGIHFMKDIDNCAIVFFFGLSFIPFFICFEFTSICLVIVLSLPVIFIWPYFRFLRYIFFGRLFGELFPV